MDHHPVIFPPRPRSLLTWSLLAALAGGVAVLVALMLTFLLTTRGGVPTILLGAAKQTATVVSAQATATSEGATPGSPTGTAGSSGPHTTATVQDGVAAKVQCPSGELTLAGGWSTDATAPIEDVKARVIFVTDLAYRPLCGVERGVPLAVGRMARELARPLLRENGPAPGVPVQLSDPAATR